MNESPAYPLASAWFEYLRRAHGSRDERKSLELGEPAEAVRAAEQVREITAEGGTRAVELVVELLNSAPDDQAVDAVGVADLCARRFGPPAVQEAQWHRAHRTH